MSGALVGTKYGKVQGAKLISALGTPYHAFFGIPYATPPVGELRFKDPLPLKPWNGTFDGTEEKPGCYEMNSLLKKIIGSEDCLRLNVFTKDVAPKKLLPVMVYIFGGGFNSGNAWLRAYSPDYLLMADVMVITMNYRLGAFGFLSLNDEELQIPGNAGLKDQSMALKFIKENIESFGGDPNNITLFGQSSGSCCVAWHCASDRSKGLFNRSIQLAGGILSEYALTPQRDWAYRLATKMGYEGNKVDREIYNFLRSADPEKIVEFQKTLIREDETDIHIAFAPSIEPYVSDGTFIWGKASEMMKHSWGHGIDMMTGGNTNEGLLDMASFRKDSTLLETMKQKILAPIKSLDPRDPIRVKIEDEFRRTYFTPSDKPDPIGLTPEERIYSNIKADNFVWICLLRTVLERQNSGDHGRTFLYRFGIDSPTQNHYRIRWLGPEQRGVAHADEICYFFKNLTGDVPAEGSMELTAIKRFVSLLTSFATTGNPNDNVIKADLQGVLWEPVDSNEPPLKGLIIEEKLRFDVLEESERYKIWDQMYKATNTQMY